MHDHVKAELFQSDSRLRLEAVDKNVRRKIVDILIRDIINTKLNVISWGLSCVSLRSTRGGLSEFQRRILSKMRATVRRGIKTKIFFI